MSVKEQAIASLEAMPEQSTWQDVVERMQFLAAIGQAEGEIDRGEGIPHEEAVRRIEEWLQKLPGRQAV